MATYQVGNVEIALKTQMDEATKKATNLISSLEKIKSSVNKTGKQIKSTGKEIKTVDAQAIKLGKSLKTAFSVGSLYVALNYARRYAASLANIVKSSVDFMETQNKFKVSMGSMYQEAINFQNKISETLGLSTSQLMDYQANFNNIIKGLGTIDQQVAYNMSESLTQMAIDFASLFNVSLESSMSKFQAALTQQVRPIRSVSGFDITQQTLGSVLNQIGVTDRTVSDLSQVEKRLVIIIALQKQMANVGAMGDFARTIEQPANQLKILEQTLIDIGIQLGNFVLAYVAPALAYVNGFLMAMKTLLQGLVSFFGGVTTESPSIDDYLQTDDAVSGVEDTTQAIKDLKKATTGIDELNIINQQDDSEDSGGGGGLGYIDPRISEAIESYSGSLDKVKMKATEIRDRILEWLGYTGDWNETISDSSTRLSKIVTALKVISAIIAVIAGVKIGSSLVKGISGFVNGIKTLTGTSLISKIGQVFALVNGGAGTFGEALVTVFPFLGKISSALSSLSGGFAAVAAAIGLTAGELIAVIAIIVGSIAIGILIWKNMDKIKEYLSKFKEWLSEKWEEFKEKTKEKIQELVDKIVAWFEALPERIGYAIGFVVGKLIAWAENIKTWITEELPIIIDNIVQWFKDLPGKIYDAIVKVKDKIVEWAGKVKTWFSERLPEILNNIIDWFKKLPENLVTLGKNIIIGLYNGIVEKWNWLKQKFLWLLGGFKDIISDVIGGFNEGVKAGYESVPKYANGGFPTRGDYFLANENGSPEYVGSIGGRTAVANTNQIVQGISLGVSMANAETNNLSRQQIQLLQSILNKDTNTYLDGRKVSDQLKKSQAARGFNPVVGGFAYV